MSAAWDYFLENKPDVALLQEVAAIPVRVSEQFAFPSGPAMGRYGKPQKFSTAILVHGQVGPVIPIVGPLDWVNAELELFGGNLLARVVKPDKLQKLNVVSVHSPAWPVDRARLAGLDVSAVKLTQNPDVWVADLIWASLLHQPPAPHDPWIIAGDFNTSETFDLWPGGPRGNREYLDRMASLGLVECLRQAQGALTPTFRNPRRRAVKHQMDHLFTTRVLTDRLRSCDTGSREQVFGGGLSDHLPIIAEFSVEPQEARA
jgi:endonuclease/exonuclease/phosphatase family metal-dependent hydrolase